MTLVADLALVDLLVDASRRDGRNASIIHADEAHVVSWVSPAGVLVVAAHDPTGALHLVGRPVVGAEFTVSLTPTTPTPALDALLAAV